MSSLCKSLLAAALLVSIAGAAHAAGMSYSFGSRYESPERNNYLSARYDYLLQTNLRFRRYRMWKECHPINWPSLHAECIASFDQYEPVLR